MTLTEKMPPFRVNRVGENPLCVAARSVWGSLCGLRASVDKTRQHAGTLGPHQAGPLLEVTPSVLLAGSFLPALVALWVACGGVHGRGEQQCPQP